MIYPLIVRQKDNGNYEIISGHRRKKACELAGIEEVPVIVKDLTDDEAIIYMVDSNKQREKVLPSEKAFAYKMRLDAEKRQGKRTDLTSAPVGQKLEKKTTREKIAKDMGESASNVQRYIRLTELIPELLEYVDEEKIALRPAVEISYLKKEEQCVLLNTIKGFDCTPSLAQAIDMRKRSQENSLKAEDIDKIMEQQKANQIEKIKLNSERITKVLPKNITGTQNIENFIIKCIEEHNQREKNKSRVR